MVHLTGSTCTILSLLSSLTFVTATSSPKVLSADFVKKSTADNTWSGLQRRASDPLSAQLTNVQDVFYYLNITLGTPAQNLAVQLDTGSSDLWVLASDANLCTKDAATNCPLGTFDSSQSSSFVGVVQGGFNITYVLGDSDTGDIVNDTLKVGDITLEQTTFGLVNSAAEGDNNGILGVGYITGESTIETENATYPNFVQALYDQGHIESRAFSLWLNDLNASTGTVLFGGIDTSKYTGSLTSVSIHPDVYSGQIDSYDLPLTSVTFRTNSSTPQSSNLITSDSIIPVTLDSGSTDCVLPNDLAAELYLGIGAITTSSSYGSALIPCSYADSPATITFQFAGPSGPEIAVPISEFTLPLVSDSGGPLLDPETNVPVCRFGVSFSDSGPTLLGDVFLRSAYVVYDIDRNTVSLAQTNFNSSSSPNIIAIPALGSSIPSITSTATVFAPTAQPTFPVAAQTTNPSVGLSVAAASEFSATRQATPTWDLGLASSQTAAVTTGTGSSGATKTGAAVPRNRGQGAMMGAVGVVLGVMMIL